MNITFGICTYNRKDILMKSAESLRNIDGYDHIHIRIYDDCSSEFDQAFLESIFPNASTIIRQENNFGADRNTFLMYKDFLNSNDEWFFNADSDLIYRKDILKRIEELSKSSDGFFSLFNTNTHPTTQQFDDYVIKEHVGAAGCCIRRDLIEKIVENITETFLSFDYNFCTYLKNNNKRIMVSYNSYVQHIGIVGYNSEGLFFDYGKHFKVDSIVNGEIIESIFEQHSNYIESLAYGKHWIFYRIVFDHKRLFKALIRRMKNKFKNATQK